MEPEGHTPAVIEDRQTGEDQRSLEIETWEEKGCQNASQRSDTSSGTSRMKKAGKMDRKQMFQAETGYVEARIPERVVLVRRWKANQGQILQGFAAELRN